MTQQNAAQRIRFDRPARKGDAALLLALAAGQTVRDACKAAGISERTATRRLADHDFRRQVAALRAEMTSRALGRMTDSMAAAADTLLSLLTAEGESVRLGAARSILELGTKLRETVELEERLANLEQQAAGKGNRRNGTTSSY